MKTPFPAAVLVLAALSGADAPPDPVAWIGATLIDGTGAPPVRDAVVVVAGEKILAVGPRSGVAIPEGARRVDAAGRWIVPGFTDVRVSLALSGDLYSRPEILNLADLFNGGDSRAPAVAPRDVAETLARHLACGVTTVADAGGPDFTFALRNSLASLAAPAPRVAVSGPLVSAHIGPAAAANGDEDLPTVAVDTPEAASEIVRSILAKKPDFVNVDFPFWPENEIDDYAPIVRAAIAEAHAAGVRAAVRARRLEAVRSAVAAGADAIVGGPDDAPLDTALLTEMKRRGVVYATSLVAFEAFAEVVRRNVVLSEIEKRFGDQDAIRSFGDVGRWPENRLPDLDVLGDLDPTAVLADNLRRVRDAGVEIAVGSTAGNIGVLHGPAIHREFELLEKAGLSAGAVLAAATRGGAAFLGRLATSGTIEKGKLADFVVLAADPLAGASSLSKIHRVVRGGAEFDPETLVPKR